MIFSPLSFFSVAPADALNYLEPPVPEARFSIDQALNSRLRGPSSRSPAQVVSGEQLPATLCFSLHDGNAFWAAHSSNFSPFHSEEHILKFSPSGWIASPYVNPSFEE